MAASSPTSSRRRPAWIYLLVALVTLAVIWAIVALAFSSGQDGADPQQAKPGPAETLKDAPQSDKLGGNSGGGE